MPIPGASIHGYGLSGNELEKIYSSDNTLHTADIGIIGQRHNRYFAPGAAMNTHPGDDTRCVTWTQQENVRRYRIYVEGGSAGDYIKVTEDAPDGAAAALWLDDPTSSATEDVEHWRQYTANPTSATTVQTAGWSEWREMSKHPSDISLSRLDFEASSASTDFTIFVEAE